jgi:predicted transcriptional regulator
MKKIWMSIINWLFGQNSVNSIIEESEKVVVAFSSLENRLTEINDKITNEMKDLINKLEKETAMLGLRQSSNERIASNINKLLNGKL